VPLIDDQLADQLLGRAQAEGIELLGPDGLLSQVTKAVLERALAKEMTGHLGYEKHDTAGRGSGNSRIGSTGKTLLTDVGAVDLQVPRDRNGSFDLDLLCALDPEDCARPTGPDPAAPWLALNRWYGGWP
jgi:putative transposase